MSGRRERERRRARREIEGASRREAAAAEAARMARLSAFVAEDSAEGPALPCPECDALGRRWATAEEALAARRAHDARWGLVAPEGEDRRRVAICPACGSASVVPDFPG